MIFKLLLQKNTNTHLFSWKYSAEEKNKSLQITMTKSKKTVEDLCVADDIIQVSLKCFYNFASIFQ